MVDLPTFGEFSGWCQLNCLLLLFTSKIGEDEPILTNIQMGWNHQLDIEKH